MARFYWIIPSELKQLPIILVCRERDERLLFLSDVPEQSGQQQILFSPNNSGLFIGFRHVRVERRIVVSLLGSHLEAILECTWDHNFRLEAVEWRGDVFTRTKARDNPILVLADLPGIPPPVGIVPKDMPYPDNDEKK